MVTVSGEESNINEKINKQIYIYIYVSYQYTIFYKLYINLILHISCSGCHRFLCGQVTPPALAATTSEITTVGGADSIGMTQQYRMF